MRLAGRRIFLGLGPARSPAGPFVDCVIHGCPSKGALLHRTVRCHDARAFACPCPGLGVGLNLSVNQARRVGLANRLVEYRTLAYWTVAMSWPGSRSVHLRPIQGHSPGLTAIAGGSELPNEAGWGRTLPPRGEAPPHSKAWSRRLFPMCRAAVKNPPRFFDGQPIACFRLCVVVCSSAVIPVCSGN